MQNRTKKAGQSTFKMASQRKKTMIIIAVVGIILFALLLFALNNTTALGIGGIGFLVLLVLIKLFPDILDRVLAKKQKEKNRAIRGADAEVQIGSILDGLSEDYYVLHDLDSQYGNIDHLVIGKETGLFLIETKSHRGKVNIKNNTLFINDRLPEKDFFAQTLKNAYWLRSKITETIGVTPWITPIIVFTNAFVPFSSPVKGIKVTNKKYLLTTIMNASGRGSINKVLWDKKDSVLASLTKETGIN